MPHDQYIFDDTNVWFLRHLDPRIQVVEGDFGAASLPAESFDLVHVRYVLIHHAQPRPVLSAMLRALKPGGVLVLEEPNFSAAAALTGPARLQQAVAE